MTVPMSLGGIQIQGTELRGSRESMCGIVSRRCQICGKRLSHNVLYCDRCSGNIGKRVATGKRTAFSKELAGKILPGMRP